MSKFPVSQNRMSKISLVLFLLLLKVSLFSQIFNVEQRRLPTDTIGWAGKIGISFNASQFTRSLISLNTNSHVQYESEKNLYLLVLNNDLVNGDGENFDNRGYAHFRYNRKVSKLVSWEAFTQVQYNSLTKITLRWLTGTGPRFKITKYEKIKAFAGVAYMYEYEEIAESSIFHYDHRASSYLTLTYTPRDNFRLSSTSYFQPLLSDPSDFRVSSDISINFAISKNLQFTTVVAYLFDSNPPSDVPGVNYLVRNGVTYRF